MNSLVGPFLFTGRSGGGSNTIGVLVRALDAATLRQEAVAANLANVNTPGYQRRDVVFSLPQPGDEAAAAATLVLARTDSRHLNGRRAVLSASGADGPRLVTDAGGAAMRLDGNTVDPDAEAARLAETEITFAALTQALTSQFGALRIAITGSASGR